MSALPPPGMADRLALEREALLVRQHALEKERGDIPNALYATYMVYRYRFLGVYGLLDTAPGKATAWRNALEDARSVERLVAARWAQTIQAAYEQGQL